jgi:hypothetical protein
MESIFSKDPAARTATVYDRIGPEISHLQKGNSVRDRAEARNKKGAWAATIALFILLVLFFMDPFLFAMHKSSAIKAYIYLHNYGSSSSTQAMAASRMFSADELQTMNNRHGSFQSFFASPADAQEAATSAVDFMNKAHNLRYGDYDTLDPIGKLRYMLFIRIGLYPPIVWQGLNPTLD